jgi:microcystin degradation protein MlrC
MKHHRVLVAECMQEISSFNPLQSGYDNFHIERGEEMRAQEGLNTSLGGAFGVFRETGLDPVLAIGARAGSAGLLSAAGWKKLSAEVLEAIARQAATGVEGMYFSMHGAMAADGELDPEGYLLTETRKILGPDKPSSSRSTCTAS